MLRVSFNSLFSLVPPPSVSDRWLWPIHAAVCGDHRPEDEDERRRGEGGWECHLQVRRTQRSHRTGHQGQCAGWVFTICPIRVGLNPLSIQEVNWNYNCNSCIDWIYVELTLYLVELLPDIIWGIFWLLHLSHRDEPNNRALFTLLPDTKWGIFWVWHMGNVLTVTS